VGLDGGEDFAGVGFAGFFSLDGDGDVVGDAAGSTGLVFTIDLGFGGALHESRGEAGSKEVPALHA
jgi:hypothetical protein